MFPYYFNVSFRYFGFILVSLGTGPQLILQFYSGLSMVIFKENYNFFQDYEGSNIFQGGLYANLHRNP